VRYENRTFLNKGQGPYNQFLSNLASNVATGDKNWKNWYGSVQAGPFNTGCCATDKYYRQAKCAKYDMVEM
jgi:hypothetical protein